MALRMISMNIEDAVLRQFDDVIRKFKDKNILSERETRTSVISEFMKQYSSFTLKGES